MTSDGLWHDARWYEALTLEERLALVRSGDARSWSPEDRERGKRRLGRWRKQRPLDDDAVFARWLQTLSATEDEVLRALGAPATLLRDGAGSAPEWLSQIERAFEEAPDREGPGAAAPGFGALIEPFLDSARRRVQRAADDLAHKHGSVPFSQSTIVDTLLSDYPDRLAKTTLDRVLFLELNVARLEGRLEGDAPAQRFQHFVQRLRDRAIALSLFLEYPVLARRVCSRVHHWADRSIDFLNRLCADQGDIQSTFSPTAPLGALASVRSDVADGHRGGKTVMIATFTGGTSVVYKPRSMSVDSHFQALLRWVNRTADAPELRELAILRREGYGWMEFVHREGCTSRGELARFHQRQGMLLALLHVLRATDFHEENLISAGEQPVLVDLESLFHPDRMPSDASSTELEAYASLMQSVLRVGLLPYRVFVDDCPDGVQVGGMASSAGQMSPRTAPVYENAGTDTMRLARKRIPMTEHANRPTLNGTMVSVLDYSDDLMAGFARMYDHCRHRRDELLHPSGPLAPFTGDDVRAVLRPTYVYGTFVYESFHPDLLRSGLEQSLFFDRLWLAPDVMAMKDTERTIRSEQAALHRMDIPIFGSRTDSRDIWTDVGDRIPNFFAAVSRDQVYDTVQALSDSDREQQIWVIRASLSTLVNRKTSLRRHPRPTEIAPETEPASLDRELLIADARAIGDRLEAIAIKRKGEMGWLGLEPRGSDSVELTPARVSLFEGLTGIALFYAHLADHTRCEKYDALARAVLATAKRRLRQEMPNEIGAFSGRAGIASTLGHLGVLWQDAELLSEAEAMASEMAPRVSDDRHFDVVNGAAGAILALLPLYRIRKSQTILRTLLTCGEVLEAKPMTMPRGIGWRAPNCRYPIAGFSHGAAGIALALLELDALTGQHRYRDLAMGALDYERSIYSEEARNWPVLPRESDPVSGPMEITTAWCHGAPGVALSRARCLRHTDDRVIRAELDRAIETTLRTGFGSSHSLCHGDFGNLDILYEAACVPESRWRATFDRLAPATHRNARAHGWVCGNPTGVETPGLMTGLAGIGYALLRLAAPDRVPSVLALDFPARPAS